MAYNDLITVTATVDFDNLSEQLNDLDTRLTELESNSSNYDDIEGRVQDAERNIDDHDSHYRDSLHAIEDLDDRIKAIEARGVSSGDNLTLRLATLEDLVHEQGEFLSALKALAYGVQNLLKRNP